MLVLAINKPILWIMPHYNEGLFPIYYLFPCKYPYHPRGYIMTKEGTEWLNIIMVILPLCCIGIGSPGMSDSL